MPHETVIELFKRGDALDRAGRHAEAWDCYHAACQAKFAQIEWDDRYEDYALDAVVSFFPPDYGSQYPVIRHHRVTPIFIVGMPRSGSTLIEQILDMHPQVAGIGEVPFLSESIASVLPLNGAFPESLAALSHRDLEKIRNRYLNRVAGLAPHHDFVVDKMLSNFYYLGIIKILFPHAKIIHTARDPLDTCFSCYKKLFNENNLGFTYDLHTLGRYHSRYRVLMRHWSGCLPAGSIFTVQYENTVADLGATVRGLLGYLGLPWSSDCLRYYENDRVVRTASKDQVNKPIYTSAVGSAAPYREALLEGGLVVGDSGYLAVEA